MAVEGWMALSKGDVAFVEHFRDLQAVVVLRIGKKEGRELGLCGSGRRSTVPDCTCSAVACIYDEQRRTRGSVSA